MALPPQLSRAQRAQLEALRHAGDLPDDAEFLELAIAHQVAAPLAVWALRRGDSVPAIWKARLNQVRAMNLRILAQAKALRDVLNDAGLPWLAAKGVLRALDPVLPERFIGDLDLYVPQASAEAAVRVLEPIYRPDNAAWDAYIMAQVLVLRDGEGVPLDLHRSWHGWVGGHEGEIEPLKVPARSIDGFALPDAEDDLRIALYEMIYSTWNNSLRRIWETQELALCLPEERLEAVLKSMGLRQRSLQIGDYFLKRPSLRRSRRFAGVLAMLMVSRRPLQRAFKLLCMRLGRGG